MDSGDIHILAVDDSNMDRKVVERLLKISSYKVTTVDSAFRALEVLGMAGSAPVVMNAVKINLIITDYCMPEMTGYDLLKKVKESSALKEIPVVIMSSENVAERITMCLAEGAKEFILKPLRLADVKRLRSHIKHESGDFVVDTVKRRPVTDAGDTAAGQPAPAKRQRTTNLTSVQCGNNINDTTNNCSNNDNGCVIATCPNGEEVKLTLTTKEDQRLSPRTSAPRRSKEEVKLTSPRREEAKLTSPSEDHHSTSPASAAPEHVARRELNNETEKAACLEPM